MVVAFGLAVGVEIVELLKFAAGVQVYVMPPLALIVAPVPPIHIVPLVVVIVGSGRTVTVVVAVSVHILVPPITKYCVVAFGETVWVELAPLFKAKVFVITPEVHKYAVAPVAVKDAVSCPTQIVPLVTVTVGFGNTVIVPVP